MKVLDMPVSVVGLISRKAESLGRNISDPEKGFDIRISTNGMTGMDVRYKVDYVKESYLTPVEKNVIEDRKLDKKRPYDLTTMFKGCSYCEARHKLSRKIG